MAQAFILAVILTARKLVGCSSHKRSPDSAYEAPVSGEQSQGTGPDSSAESIDINSFSGPILEHCHARADDTIISKLDIKTGRAIDIATYPVNCYDVSLFDIQQHAFRGQLRRLYYSRDFHKRVVPSSTGEIGRDDVGYYDYDKNSIVNVSRIISPRPTGDFGNYTAPRHDYAMFDDHDLFVFYDYDTGKYNFFDTDSQRLVRTGEYPESGWPSVVAKTKGATGEIFRRTCQGEWAIDGNRYLREINGTKGVNGRDIYLGIDSISAEERHDDNCDKGSGQRISPPTDGISGAAASPDGSTVIFLMSRPTSTDKFHLYQANIEDPENPTPIHVAGDMLRGKNRIVEIIDWR
ncbi:hypothetical protein [Mycolicibacter kumamotonensis]|uniref:Uncharacterized protein n=1 Tax=Mycolicibacter kumamotonensis TaxID=354243 RepID=A0A7K3LEZ4_9MYCO|nr:hypothetical protein [Mycolicibacter kumamotonensis]NDJ90931.1 hypothetical protein [Mycolicibacter kumamotonensis]